MQMLTCGFKVHVKVMLAPANYNFSYQELRLFFYRPVKKLQSAPLKDIYVTFLYVLIVLYCQWVPMLVA